MHIFSKISVFLVLIFICQPLSELNAQWKKTNGPYGGAKLGNIISDGINLFGATGDSIYISSDNGNSWKAVYSSGLPYYPEFKGLRIIFSLGYYKGTLYAGTFAGVYRSNNNGESWECLFGDYGTNTRVTAIGFIDTILLAGIQTMYFSGIFRSTDNGESWSRIDSFHANLQVNSFLAKNDTIFAGSNAGLLRSNNRGESWEVIDSIGITNSEICNMIFRKNKLYIGNFLGLFCSANNGESWETISEIPMLTFTEMEDNLIVADYNGVRLSKDEGKTWISRNNGLIYMYSNFPNVNSLASFKNILFATTEEGLFTSTDTGATWSIVNVRDKLITTNSLISSNDGTLYAGTDAGFFRSTNKGREWIGASTGLSTYIVNCAVILDSNLFIGTNRGIYRSSNKGEKWVPSGFTNSNSNNVRAITVKDSDIFAAIGSAIFKSTNSGENWDSLNIDFKPYYANTILIDGENIFVGTSNGFFKSSDNGLNWQQSNTGLKDTHIITLFNTEDRLYAGTSLYGVYFSTNNGEKWSSLPVPMIPNLTVFSFAKYNDVLFLGTGYGPMMYSLNNSRFNPEFKLGMPTLSIVKSIAIKDSIIFAGTRENNVWSRPISDIITGIKEGVKEYPADYHLYQNYPNPFNPTTTIEYSITNTSFVSIEIFDILGRSLTQLVNEVKQPGTYSVIFDAGNVSSGVYFYSITAGSFHQIRKMVVMK